MACVGKLYGESGRFVFAHIHILPAVESAARAFYQPSAIHAVSGNGKFTFNAPESVGGEFEFFHRFVVGIFQFHLYRLARSHRF